MKNNKYLEKIAEFYSVRPTKEDKNLNGIESVQLNRKEMDRLIGAKNKNFSLGKNILSSAAGATVVGAFGHRLGKDFAGGKLGAAPLILGSLFGSKLGGDAYNNYVHEKTLNKLNLNRGYKV